MLIFSKILKHEYYDKLFLSFFFVSIAKLISFIKEIVLAREYGTNLELESFLFLFNVLNLIGGIFLYSITFYIVPILQKKKTNDSLVFKKQILIFFFKIGCFLSFILFFLYFFGLENNLFSLNPDVLQICQENFYYFIYIFPFWILTFVLTSFLISKENQIGSFFESFPSLVTLILLIFFASDFNTLMIGLILGIIIQLFFLFIQNKENFISIEINNFNSNSFSYKAIYLIIFIQLLMGTHYLVDHFIVASLSNSALAEYNYAYKTFSFFVSFGTLVISRTLLPIFSNVKSKLNTFKSLLKQTEMCFFIFAIISIPLFFFAKEVISFIFERGLFTKDDTINVTKIFEIYILILPFFMSYILMITFLYAQKIYKTIIIFCLIFLAIKILILYMFFIESKIIILPISSLVASLSGFLYLYFYFINREKNL